MGLAVTHAGSRPANLCWVLGRDPRGSRPEFFFFLLFFNLEVWVNLKVFKKVRCISVIV
jgi:hypothetical protein